MKLSHFFLPALSLFGIMAFTGTALADPVTIGDITTSLSASSPKQSGRLSRSGVPSDFATPKTYPGTINTTTSYSYTTFTFDSSLFAGGQNVEVSLYDFGNTAGLFASAYAGSYNPASQGTNYLADIGSSPNSFTNDALFFNFVLNANTNLVIVVNETLGGTNSASLFGNQFNLVVQHSATDATGDAFGDPVPEPSSLVLLGTGALGLLGVARRRFSA